MRIFGSDVRRRNIFLHHAEILRKAFLLKTGIEAHEKIPIVILLAPEQCLSEPFVVRIQRTSASFFKIQLNLQEAFFDTEDFSLVRNLDEALISAFLLQAIGEENHFQFSKEISATMFPAWLTVGLAQTLQEEAALGSSSLMLPVPPSALATFIAEEPPRAQPLLFNTYAASAALLVESGLQTKENRIAFQKDLASLLKMRWLAAWNQQEIESQWWRLIEETNGIAKKKKASSLLSNVQQLQALMITSRCAQEKSASCVVTAQGKFTVPQLFEQLQSLQQNVNPMTCEVVAAYSTFLTQLPKMPSAIVSQAIIRFQKKVIFLAERSRSMIDFLNWYEITKSAPLQKIVPFLQRGIRERSANAMLEKYLDAMEERY